jgi:hypothetical protein
MSEVSQGPGWWQAADLKWYPPERHAEYVAPLPPPPKLLPPPRGDVAQAGERRMSEISCPQCRLVDQVQNVQAIYSAGVHSIQGHGSFGGTGYNSGGGSYTVSGLNSMNATQTSALADALAPAPATKKNQWGTLVIASLFFVIGFLSLRSAFGAGGGLFVAVICVPLIGWAIVSQGRIRTLRTKVKRGSAAARAVWGPGFYCHRCAGCFWPSSPAPGIPAGQLMDPNQFRHLVWQAGGYAS